MASAALGAAGKSGHVTDRPAAASLVHVVWHRPDGTGAGARSRPMTPRDPAVRGQRRSIRSGRPKTSSL